MNRDACYQVGRLTGMVMCALLLVETTNVAPCDLFNSPENGAEGFELQVH